MHHPADVLENDTHKLLWDFETDHLISARRQDLIVINNNKKKKKKSENLQNCTLRCIDWSQIKTESEKKDKYLGLAKELTKKTIEHEGDDYTKCDRCIRHSN